ncbi:hypothetical protein BDV26DRAFT_262931 [Aspergillus bertholletiae]|uniref:Uncharacterized protein n=1 Tax=Aspergillus bertholletiae TaxID=1226010 RepID=A0A5N7B7Q2_9EURO|nr:hypothetical protein BDV26DRAFT_262931 [Aspergillus bertholletiae]
MVPSRTQLPAPVGAADATGNTARPLQKRVLDLNREATRMLEYLTAHCSSAPKRFVEFVQLTWTLTDDLAQFPVGDAWQTQLHELQRAINDVRKDTNELTARVDPLRSFAQAAAKAPPPCHHQSSHNSASTAPVRPDDLERDRAVTVKVGDSAMAKNLCRLTSEDLVKRAEKHRRNGAVKDVRATPPKRQGSGDCTHPPGGLGAWLRRRGPGRPP